MIDIKKIAEGIVSEMLMTIEAKLEKAVEDSKAVSALRHQLNETESRIMNEIQTLKENNES